MSFPDDTSRERDERPGPNRPGADEGHAIPFGEGVYGLGRGRGEPPTEDRTSREGSFSEHSGTFGDDVPPSAKPGPEFDFRRLAEELGFEGHVEGRQCVGFCPICRGADLLRTVATPELRTAWNQFARELARALAAAAERYAGPAESEPGSERVTEIPID